jgi:hypothetical protein
MPCHAPQPPQKQKFFPFGASNSCNNSLLLYRRDFICSFAMPLPLPLDPRRHYFEDAGTSFDITGIFSLPPHITISRESTQK